MLDVPSLALRAYGNPRPAGLILIVGKLAAMKRSRGAQKTGLPPRPAGGKAKGDAATEHEAEMRLQKHMARAGVGSRRQCEALIAEGRVQIDGRTITELGTKVAAGQQVAVDGVPLGNARLVHYLVNKPTGVVSTNFDPSGRPRVIDMLPNVSERLFTVGRLDMSSEGLILLTNDGELANRLAHPRYGVEKTYLVQVAGSPDQEVLASLRRGVHLAEGLARATSVRVKKSLQQSTLLEIVLSEGKNREIRRILAKVGHKVVRLRRIAIGPLRLGELATGEFRRITPEELLALRAHRRVRAKGSKRSAASARPHLRPGGTREPAAAVAAPVKKPARENYGTVILPEDDRPADSRTADSRPARPAKAARPAKFSARPGKFAARPDKGAHGGRGKSTERRGKSSGQSGDGARAGKPSRPAKGVRGEKSGFKPAQGGLATKPRTGTGSKLRRKHKGRRG